jgi:tRNA(Glu) U13 pseudouridine synthase TruD
MIPLPLAFGAPLLTARIRTTPDDFQVDELPAFEATGEGEHLLLHIRKRVPTPCMWPSGWPSGRACRRWR